MKDTKYNPPIDEEYCSTCGRETKPPRIDFKYILQEIANVINLKKGILLTIKELVIRPGESIRVFIHEDRRSLVQPIVFIIFCSFFYTVLQHFFHFEDQYFEDSYSKLEADSAIIVIVDWVRKNYGYVNILMGVFIAFFLKIIFRKYNYNFFELLVLMLFVMGIGMLLYSVAGVIESFIGYRLWWMSGSIGIFYTAWAIGQFYEKGNYLNYFKGLLAYLFGWLLSSIFAVAIGVVIDIIIK